jgi:hypothetical protein
MDEASLRRRPARGRKHRVSAAPRSWLSRGRLLLVLRPKPRRFCWPWLARSITGRRRSYIRPCRSASVIAKSATDSQLIVALDHRSLRVPGMSDGARNVDCPRLSGKAPAGDFKRGLTSPTPPAISARRAGRAFPLPSRSSVQRLPCATIFPSAETAHHTSVPAIHAHADCLPLHRSTTAEPSCARCKQSARPATRMTIGRHCMRRPSYDLLSWGCRSHLRSSFNCGRITDVVEFLIRASCRLASHQCLK